MSKVDIEYKTCLSISEVLNRKENEDFVKSLMFSDGTEVELTFKTREGSLICETVLYNGFCKIADISQSGDAALENKIIPYYEKKYIVAVNK